MSLDLQKFKRKLFERLVAVLVLSITRLSLSKLKNIIKKMSILVNMNWTNC